eukprot:354186-Chlamydomonas_euryale.AAC.5
MSGSAEAMPRAGVVLQREPLSSVSRAHPKGFEKSGFAWIHRDPHPDSRRTALDPVSPASCL